MSPLASALIEGEVDVQSTFTPPAAKLITEDGACSPNPASSPNLHHVCQKAANKLGVAWAEVCSQFCYDFLSALSVWPALSVVQTEAVQFWLLTHNLIFPAAPQSRTSVLYRKRKPCLRGELPRFSLGHMGQLSGQNIWVGSTNILQQSCFRAQ